MKNELIYIETENKKYPLSFNLNVMEEIQEQYGSLDRWGELTKGDGEPLIKDLKAGVMAMLNEGIEIENENNGTNEPLLNSKQVGRVMSKIGLKELTNKIQEATINATKTDGGSKNE